MTETLSADAFWITNRFGICPIDAFRLRDVDNILWRQPRVYRNFVASASVCPDDLDVHPADAVSTFV